MGLMAGFRVLGGNSGLMSRMCVASVHGSRRNSIWDTVIRVGEGRRFRGQGGCGRALTRYPSIVSPPTHKERHEREGC